MYWFVCTRPRSCFYAFYHFTQFPNLHPLIFGLPLVDVFPFISHYENIIFDLRVFYLRALCQEQSQGWPSCITQRVEPHPVDMALRLYVFNDAVSSQDCAVFGGWVWSDGGMVTQGKQDIYCEADGCSARQEIAHILWISTFRYRIRKSSSVVCGFQ